MTYKLINDENGNPVSISKTVGNVTLGIPFVADNTDYKEYLEWLAEGNEPEPADE